MKTDNNKEFKEMLKKLREFKDTEDKPRVCPHCGRCPVCGRRYNDWFDYPRYPVITWEYKEKI